MAAKENEITAQTPDAKVHGGHRARMREKLFAFGEHIFDDHELLEMLLYNVIPMRDTNPIAHRLLAVFGSIEGVFSASREDLMQVEGVKEKAANLILSTARLADDALFAPPIRKRYDSHSFLGRYFVDRLGTLTHPETHMMMLTNSMELIATERMFEGEFSDADCHISKFISQALKKGASVVILAHNHPYGPLYETQADHYMTARFKNDFSLAGILFIEHYIICGSAFVGTIGKIDTLQFYQTNEVAEFIREREAQRNADVFIRP